MNSNLIINIYLIDGSIKKYTQDDPKIIKSILDKIHPQKIFSQNTLAIPGLYSYSVIPCKSVSRIDFITSIYPDWINTDSSWNLTQISEEEFKQKLNSLKSKPIQDDSSEEIGKIHQGFTEIELMNNQRLYIHVTGKVQPRADRLHLIQQLFSSPSLYYKRREGGIIFINPLNITRITFYPGIKRFPPNSWQANPIYE